MASTRKHLIEADEALIIVVENNGKRYIRDSNFFGEFGNEDLASTWLGDDVVEIRRANTETWASEDITEHMAQDWITDADNADGGSLVEPEDDGDFSICEDRMPLYVKRSKAWKRWMDDVEAETPINMQREYGTYSAISGHAA